MIKINGNNVVGKAEKSPAQVEPTISATPVIRQIVIAAIPDLLIITLHVGLIFSPIVEWIIFLKEDLKMKNDIIGIIVARYGLIGNLDIKEIVIV